MAAFFSTVDTERVWIAEVKFMAGVDKVIRELKFYAPSREIDIAFGNRSISAIVTGVLAGDGIGIRGIAGLVRAWFGARFLRVRVEMTFWSLDRLLFGGFFFQSFNFGILRKALGESKSTKPKTGNGENSQSS